LPASRRSRPIYLGCECLALLNKILLPAAKKDPAAAIAGLDGVPDDLYQTAAGAVLVGWAENHPWRHWSGRRPIGIDVAEAKRLVSFGDEGNGFNPLISAALNADRETTMAWLLAQPTSRERDAMLLEAVRGGIPEQKIAVFNELSPEAQVGAVNSVLTGMDGGSIGKRKRGVKGLPPGPNPHCGVYTLAMSAIL